MKKNRKKRFVERMTALLGGAEAGQLLESLNRPISKTVRYHSRRCDPAHLPGEPVPWYPGFGRYWHLETAPSQTLEYAAGKYYIQEAGAMLAIAAASRVVDFSDKIVLDLCAAPGGKTTQAAELVTSGYLVANEVVKKRVAPLTWNVGRHRLHNVVVTSLAGDYLARSLPGFFDIVVVDAPCSGEGLFQIGKHSLDQWSEKDVLFCARRQHNILLQAFKLLRPGGVLVYSTCTFAQEENEDQVEKMLLLGLQPIPFPDLPRVSGAISPNPKVLACARRIFPHRDRGAAGAFVALLQKEPGPIGTKAPQYHRGIPAAQPPKALPPAIDSAAAVDYFYEKRGVVNYFSHGEIPQFLYDHSFQTGAPLLDKLRGDALMFGSVQLAAADARLELDYENAESYVSGGEPHFTAADGDYFASFRGTVLGPLRVEGGQVHNLLPGPLQKK